MNSSVVCGSTHDYLAFRAPSIGENLYTQGQPSGSGLLEMPLTFFASPFWLNVWLFNFEM